MTIQELQAYVDTKPDKRELLNVIVDYLQNLSPGGGVVNTIYSADDALAGERHINMNGNAFTINDGVDTILALTAKNSGDPQQLVSVWDDTVQSHSLISVNTEETKAVATMQINFDSDGVDMIAMIKATADASVSKLVYTANHHKFVNIQEFADNAAAIVGGLEEDTIYRTGDVLKIVHL